jgi:hypothetical protein
MSFASLSVALHASFGLRLSLMVISASRVIRFAVIQWSLALRASFGLRPSLMVISASRVIKSLSGQLMTINDHLMTINDH